jgi:hypothetical protein
MLRYRINLCICVTIWFQCHYVVEKKRSWNREEKLDKEAGRIEQDSRLVCRQAWGWMAEERASEIKCNSGVEWQL